jgi:type IV pilus assembly protein PilW
MKPHHIPQRGVSLVELLVSLVIGLVVVGTVFANYLNSASGSRYTAAMSQVTEDATLALSLLRNHIAMAGYSLPQGVTTNGMTPRLTGLVVRGCSGGFADATNGKTDPATVTCANAAGKADSLLVRYEADLLSTPTVSNNTVPSDCLGNGLVATATAGQFVADNRFMISTDAQGMPSLSCRGNGGTAAADADLKQSAQPLVGNVTDLRLTYGVAGNLDASGKASHPVRYISASDVSKATDAPTLIADWARVVSVRACVVVRSAEPVLPEVTRYRDCSQSLVTPADRRIYKAFTTTILLNNRISAASLPGTPAGGG